MMTKEEKLAMYAKKAAFIRDLDAVVAGNNSVEKISYEVYDWGNNATAEVILVHYIGGAYSVRSASGNSNAANLSLVAELVNNADYSYQDCYEKMKRDATLINIQ